jgi:hypothetical protein
MGLLSKVAAVSTLGTSKLIVAGIHALPTERNADAKAAAKNVRIWTLTSRPGHVAAELQKEIVKQARDGFELTSQNVSAGHSHMRTLQVITAVFTRTV